MHGPPTAEQLPGVVLAALATLIFGAVLGPEMPLILLGGGLAALAVRLARRDVAGPGPRGGRLRGELRGLAVAGLAIGYAEGTGKPSSDVLFSGQAALPPLVQHAASYTVGALLLLLLLLACKRLAYAISLGGFRGGPTFPALLLGAAGGIALSHLPGLPMVAAAMGIGAMSAVMLTLPLTSVLLPVVLLPSDGLALTPLVIVAVIVAHVSAAWLTPRDATPSASPVQPAAKPDAADAAAA